jgi:hypothetical protein
MTMALASFSVPTDKPTSIDTIVVHTGREAGQPPDQLRFQGASIGTMTLFIDANARMTLPTRSSPPPTATTPPGNGRDVYSSMVQIRPHRSLDNALLAKSGQLTLPQDQIALAVDPYLGSGLSTPPINDVNVAERVDGENPCCM